MSGSTRLVPVGPTPIIRVRKVSGDLTLAGWSRPEIRARADEGSLVMTVRDEDPLPPPAEGASETGPSTASPVYVEIHCKDDLELQVPIQSTVYIEQVNGDGAISLIFGSLGIDRVDGDLRLNSLNSVEARRIAGDCNVQVVAGAVILGEVNGDLRVNRVAGDVLVREVNGDMQVTNVAGNVQAQVDGDAKLVLSPSGVHVYEVQSSGDIDCRIPVDASIVIDAVASGELQVKGLGSVRGGRAMSLTIGEGESVLRLSADGDVSVRGEQRLENEELGLAIESELSWRAQELTAQISRQVETQLDSLTRQLDEKLSQIGANEELSNRIQDRVQGALRRAEEKLAEAMRAVEKRVQETERRPEGGAKRKGWVAPPPPPAPPAPPAPAKPAPPPKPTPATAEERMMILRMVDQGNISVEQAEILLAALNK